MGIPLLPLFQSLPLWLQRFLVRIAPIPAIQELRKILGVLDATIQHIYTRKVNNMKAGNRLDLEVTEGKDILTLLCKLPTTL